MKLTLHASIALWVCATLTAAMPFSAQAQETPPAAVTVEMPAPDVSEAENDEEAEEAIDEGPIVEYESCPAVPGVTAPPPADIAALEKEAQDGSATAGFDLANEFARTGKFTDAEKWYRFALYKGEGRAALGLFDLHAAKSIKLEDAENIRNYGLNLMEESAKKGGGGAAMNLAMMYLYGHGSAKDYEKARAWFLTAEAAGKPMASYELGLMYTNGLHFDVIPRRAFHYFEKAAAAGIAPATRQVAIAYHTGIGAAKDLDKAITCYQRAAEQGDMLAMRDLGNTYKYDKPGAGSADSWYGKAAAMGDPDSLYMLGRYQEAAKKKHHLSRVKVEPDYVPKE